MLGTPHIRRRSILWNLGETFGNLGETLGNLGDTIRTIPVQERSNEDLLLTHFFPFSRVLEYSLPEGIFLLGIGAPILKDPSNGRLREKGLGERQGKR